MTGNWKNWDGVEWEKEWNETKRGRMGDEVEWKEWNNMGRNETKRDRKERNGMERKWTRNVR